MIDEKQKSFLYNVVGFACGLASCIIFLEFAKRGKFLVKRKRLKKNRGYIRLSRLYRKRMRENDGIKFCIASWDLARLQNWRDLNIYVNFIPKRFKRRVLPWSMIRRKK